MRYAATGIVLAGGASRRMGRDKATLELGGQPLLLRVAETISDLCEELIIAAADRRPRELPGLDATWVADPPGAAGPLAGLAAGLAAASHPTAIAVACDMPFLNESLLAHLLDSVQGCDAAVPLAGGAAQPLHAAYSRSSLSTVEALLRLGAPSMRDLLSRLSVKYVSESRCREFDPEGLSWFNLNTPADLGLARRQWARRPLGAALERGLAWASSPASTAAID
jgi:molybdopterin-guanine dinucleotide biosynthesis protein A